MNLVVILLVIFSSIPLSSSTPFIVLHGVSMFCQDVGSMYYTLTLSTQTRVRGSCVEVGNGLPDSWMMSLPNQVANACSKIQGMAELQGGYNMVSLSQGNMVGRGVIEQCDGPPVKNFISVGGPNAGHSSTIPCGNLPICGIVGKYRGMGIYTPYVQDHFGPAGYLKIPNDMDAYLKGCKWLPVVNNEIQDSGNAVRKKKFLSLAQIVLVLFEFDTIIMPQISSWFGYYPDGNFDRALPVQQIGIYTKDLFGLQTLDKAGKLKFFKVPGEHLVASQISLQRYMATYMT